MLMSCVFCFLMDIILVFFICKYVARNSLIFRFSRYLLAIVLLTTRYIVDQKPAVSYSGERKLCCLLNALCCAIIVYCINIHN